MNAIILSAIWGVIMMFCGVFIKSKTTPKYIAIFGLVSILISSIFEYLNHKSFFNIQINDMKKQIEELKRMVSDIKNESIANSAPLRADELRESTKPSEKSYAEKRVAELERQVAQLKKESVHSSQSVKDQNEQMKEEVSTLKNELDKKQSSLDRYANEKINLEVKFLLMIIIFKANYIFSLSYLFL